MRKLAAPATISPMPTSYQTTAPSTMITTRTCCRTATSTAPTTRGLPGNAERVGSRAQPRAARSGAIEQAKELAFAALRDDPDAVAAAVEIVRLSLRESSPQAFFDSEAFHALLGMPEAVEAALALVSVPQITLDEIQRRRWPFRAFLSAACSCARPCMNLAADAHGEVLDRLCEELRAAKEDRPELEAATARAANTKSVWARTAAGTACAPLQAVLAEARGNACPGTASSLERRSRRSKERIRT